LETEFNHAAIPRRKEMIEPALLLSAYSAGYFPMADSRDGEISWYSPDPRAVIPLETFKVSRSLRQTLKKQLFEVRWDSAFEEVVRACGGRKDTWISEGIVKSYVKLFDLGAAHSVETWSKGTLAGGLYGVALGAAFFGESMFSRERDASKIALVHLVERLRVRRFELLDTQFITPHLARFGAVEIPRKTYLRRLKAAVRKNRSWSD
jgi:leucyl/phenylalanyl-tRNA--protein transferase